MTETAGRTSYEVNRIHTITQFDETALFTETYGFAGTQGKVTLEGILFRPQHNPSQTLMIMMHPASTLQLVPMPSALAQAGLHVLCAASRYPKNDVALIMEKVLVDLGAWVRHAKEELGYQRIVLIGWSGGGALSLFYQAEAEHPTITETPAGDPIDLTKAALIPADAVILMAAHISRAKILTEFLDASVTDEQRPEMREVELDLYHAANPHQAPYTPDYMTRYRAAQIDRNRRISTWVKEMLNELKHHGGAEMERGFVVHRTMADPRWLDPSLEPNDRRPHWCYLGHPETVNVGPAGLARFSTLRSWLSQWSYDESRADGPANAARISVPFLLIENSADDAVPASHGAANFSAVASGDKEMLTIKGATHYYLNQPEHLAEAVSVTLHWLTSRHLVEN
jgi:alpha-beta hydrolase superfamily lysophospholipase